MTTPLYRVTDIRNITLNGSKRKCFTAHVLDGDAYIHLGKFTAPARTPDDQLYEHIAVEDTYHQEHHGLRR